MSLRNFHNHVKDQLIALGKGGSLFDIGVGKAGDLHKWTKHGITKVRGIDINPEFLEEARSRTSAKEKELYRMLDYKYYLVSPRTIDFHVPSEKFDMVSCQFAIHYFFKDWSSIDSLLMCVSNRLKVGGLFICTALDASRLPKLPFDTEHISIHPTEESHRISVNMQYTPYFRSKFIDEYMVYPDTLMGACDEHGLELVWMKPFEKFGFPASMTSAEKFVSSLYTAYVFRKVQAN